MDSLFSISYPWWYLGGCLLLGALYAFVLYFKDRHFNNLEGGQKTVFRLLSLLRFGLVSLIAFLLLGPLLKTLFTEVQKPYVIFLQDNSQSVGDYLAKTDSSAYVDQFNALTEQLSEDYEVKSYDFGETLKEGRSNGFKDKVTDLSGALNDVFNRYDNQNVGAVVLASDGIYNQGSNPLFSNIQMDVPIYSVAIGDTTPKRDVKIEKVLHNRIAYLGDKFTVRAEVSAYNAKGQQVVLNVYKGKANGQKLYSKSIKIAEERFFKAEDIILDADKVGIQQYTVVVGRVEGESSVENNYKSIYIDVLEGRQKILVLGASPHPDLSTLKGAIESNKNYEAEIAYIKNFGKDISAYDLVIMHGLPSARDGAQSVLQKIKAQLKPVWFIVSSQTSIAGLNAAQDILKINGANNSFDDVKGLPEYDFNLFKIEGDHLKVIEDLPPMMARYGEYEASPSSQILFRQKIGSIDTDYPLLLFKQSTKHKVAVLAGEGLWRWKIYDYEKDESAESVEELVSKTIQYLSVKDDKRKFRVSTPQNIFNEYQDVSFDAELYNDSYELVNDPEAALTVRDAEGKEYPYVFSKTANAYTLSAGVLPVGDYSYGARTSYTGNEYTAGGNFSVREVKLETLNTTADHGLLYQISNKFGGEVIGMGKIASLEDIIRARQDIKPVMYSSYKSKPLINNKWLFVGLLLLLAIEWFYRKFVGGY